MGRGFYKILIVDNDKAIAEQIKNYLSTIGFEVLGITASHDDTVKFLNFTKVDIVIMDIDINGKIDGVESCNIIYQKFHIPSIFVTSFYDEEALFLIEHSNAFGYILKPFKKEVLRVTILLILEKMKQKRTVQPQEQIPLKNDFKFCTKKNTLYRNNKEINLTKNEKKLIEILVHHKNNNISYEILFNHIWKNKAYCINKIRGAIFRLKRKFPELLITNNYELGYKIE